PWNRISDKFFILVGFGPFSDIKYFSVGTSQHPVTSFSEPCMFPYKEPSYWLAGKQSYSVAGSSRRRKAFSIPKCLASPKTYQFTLIGRAYSSCRILEIGIIDGSPSYFSFPSPVS